MTENDDSSGLARATFGGGCFWCVEAVFEQLDGVKSVTSGYAGGQRANPTYDQVCSGATGHAEVVQIEFDPAKISYEQLLEIFWEAHNPTTLNRQGADAGTQYRSIILFQNEAQREAAERSKAEAAAKFPQPIVTEIAPLTTFYAAEERHQDYFRRNSGAPYCSIVISPKLQKLRAAGRIPARHPYKRFGNRGPGAPCDRVPESQPLNSHIRQARGAFVQTTARFFKKFFNPLRGPLR